MSNIRVRCLLQQCTSATLKLPDQTTLSVGRGMVAFVAFLKDAQPDDMTKLGKSRGRKTIRHRSFVRPSLCLAKEITSVKLCENLNGQGSTTIVDLPGDLLIIPQATLGGRLNSHRFQYHQNIAKELGEPLFHSLITNLRDLCRPEQTLHAGQYGIRQIFSCETNGPAMHLIEF